MKKSLIRVFWVGLAALTFSAAVSAQGSWMGDVRDKYVISAKAGGVNLVEGTVTVVANDGTSGRLTKGDQLEAGDKVTTGIDGRAEILLNPGSYIRLGNNSSFEFKTTSLDGLEVKLGGGSAMLEVFASKDFKVTVNTPKARMFLIQSGVYRVDVLGDGAGRISVYKGRAELGDNASSLVKSGWQATLSGSVSQVTKFDSDQKDSLQAWSKSRAKDLARMSREVETASMRHSLLYSFGAGRWDMFNSFGLWTYDSIWGSYCFLPFGYGWNSPYGYGFGPYLGAYHLPPVVYQPPVIIPISGGGNGSGNGSGGGGTPNPNTPIAQNPRHPGGVQPPFTAPPFIRIQADPKSGGSVRDGGSIRSISNTRDIDTGSPIFSPAPPSAPVFAPSTTRSDSKPKGN